MSHDFTSRINPKILGAALLFYIVIVTLIFTLAPFNYHFSNLNGISGIFDMQFSDGIKNVILFIPTGFLLASIFTDNKKYIKSFLFGFLFSAFIEFNQIFIPARNPGFNDILTNEPVEKVFFSKIHEKYPCFQLFSFVRYFMDR
jgi:glycopeptide antibiotics resistance protein